MLWGVLMKAISVLVENPFLRPLHLALKSSSAESDDFALANCLGWSSSVSMSQAAVRSCVGISGSGPLLDLLVRWVLSLQPLSRWSRDPLGLTCTMPSVSPFLQGQIHVVFSEMCIFDRADQPQHGKCRDSCF